MNGSELALGDANYTLLAEGNNATGGWLESDKRATLFSIEMPFDVIVLGCVCFPLVLLIGITGNMLVIYVMCKERDMRSFTNYLLANLSICDILLLAVCVPSGLNDVCNESARHRFLTCLIFACLIMFCRCTWNIS